MARHEQFSVNELTVNKILSPGGANITPGTNPSGGMDYYVENNYGGDSNDGLSWSTPLKTLAAAITLSNTYVGASSAGWAARNRIFYRADSETADIVILPAKCDIIGVGSCDAYHMASIKGNHVPITDHFGCRFFNVRFKPADASGIGWTLTAASNGLGFYGCQFVGVESLKVYDNAISATACELLTIDGCDFDGAFTGDVIAIGAGNASGLKIVNNNIRGGANDGIVIGAATYTSINSLPIIKNNTIQVAGCTISDTPQNAITVGNYLISAAATGTDSVNANARYSAGNWYVDATKAGPWPVLDNT